MYIPIVEEPVMQTARGQNTLTNTSACVLHCIKLFHWIMSYNQQEIPAWMVIQRKCYKMLISTI